MAKIYNEVEPLVIQLTKEDINKLNYGILIDNNMRICHCDTCNKVLNDDELYYIPSINCLCCSECAQDFTNNCDIITSEDLEYEQRNCDKLTETLKIDRIICEKSPI